MDGIDNLSRLEPHPWNADPLPPRRFRLTVEHRVKTDAALTAISTKRDALLALAGQMEELDYEFVRLERIDGG